MSRSFRRFSGFRNSGPFRVTYIDEPTGLLIPELVSEVVNSRNSF